MSDNPLDPSGDPFGPPEVSIEVACLHCGEEYQSSLIQRRIESDADGNQCGFWCCPMPDCGGRGFGFDIFPTDPNYHDERGGWVDCDDEYDDGDFDEDDPDEDIMPDGPTDRAKPSGNGHGRLKLTDGEDYDVPF